MMSTGIRIMLHIPKRKVDGTLKTSSLKKSKINCPNAKWSNYSFYPTNKLRIPVDKEAIKKRS
jgi:hypothetical protein